MKAVCGFQKVGASLPGNPARHLLHLQTFVEEDFIIVSQGPEYPVKGDSNTTLYLIKASTTVNQDFDFSGKPSSSRVLRFPFSPLVFFGGSGSACIVSVSAAYNA